MELSLTNDQTAHAIQQDAILAALRKVLADSPYELGSVNVAVVDDPTIHELNRRHLNHDYPTDVLSFALEQSEDSLHGELVVSADTAAANAAEYGWSTHDELLLYVVHGALHLVGFDDQTPHDAARMREAENDYLDRCGIQRPSPPSQRTVPPADRPGRSPGIPPSCSMEEG